MTDPRIAALAEAMHDLDWESYWIEGPRGADGAVEATFNDTAFAAAILAALPPDWCGHAHDEMDIALTAAIVANGKAATLIAEQSAEIARLRAALQRIADFSGEPEAVMARLALEEKP